LFFVYEVLSYWTFTESSDPENPTTEDHVVEYRSYLNEDYFVKCLEKNYKVKENEEFVAASKNAKNVEIDCGSVTDFLERYNKLLTHANGFENASCIWD